MIKKTGLILMAFSMIASSSAFAQNMLDQPVTKIFCMTQTHLKSAKWSTDTSGDDSFIPINMHVVSSTSYDVQYSTDTVEINGGGVSVSGGITGNKRNSDGALQLEFNFTIKDLVTGVKTASRTIYNALDKKDPKKLIVRDLPRPSNIDITRANGDKITVFCGVQ